ncbi:MAG TPA: helix-turn-helix domain-containing protein, partial [Puia sp.]
GNVRELEHVIERSILLSEDHILSRIYLPEARPKLPVKTVESKFNVNTIKEMERDHIISALQRCNGRVSGSGGAAAVLGIPASTLTSKLKRFGIQKVYDVGSR